MLEKKRINSIKKFLDAGGVFPTNLILSLKGRPNDVRLFKKLGGYQGVDSGILIVKNRYDAFWVIDGQHRLYSYSKSTSNELIPCVVLESISKEVERRFFLEINREQKPIQPDLIWDLEGEANPHTTAGIISNAVRRLNQQPDSLFYDKIYIPMCGSKLGKTVNMAAFCNGIKNGSLANEIIPNGVGIKNPLHDSSSSIMVKRISDVIKRFFETILENSALKDWHKEFLLGNAGIPIVLYLLEPILAHRRRIPSCADLKPYADAICKFLTLDFPNAMDIKKLRLETTGEGIRKALAKNIGIVIRHELGDASFWPTLEESDLVREIVRMERRIGKLIAAKLLQITTSWEKQRVPPGIYANASRKAQADGILFDEALCLGDELEVIKRSDNWEEVFKLHLVGKNGFTSKEEVELAIKYLSMVRNPAQHGRAATLPKNTIAQAELYLERLNVLIPDVLD